jgi:virginiamycin B lyase
LSVSINEFPIPTPNSGSFGITAGPDGNLWFTETNTTPSQIGRINPTTHVVTEFPTPTSFSFPTYITAGPDGNLWFTEGAASNIGRIIPSTHAIKEFPIPTAHSEPEGIIGGPDGNLWFTEFSTDKIGQLNPTTDAIAEFPIPTAATGPAAITAGPDGNLWFVELDGNKIGQINPTTHAVAEFSIPTAHAALEQIAAGPDGNLWFTENAADKIGEINPTTHAVAEFSLPASSGGDPFGITAGPDGNLWFTDGPFIGEINPTTDAIAETQVASAFGEGSLTTGPDGNIWFVEQPNSFVGQAVLTATAPDLALAGTAPKAVTLGSNLTYSLTVTNNGTAGATGVTIADTLPSGITFVSASGGITPVNGVLTFAIGSLAAGADTSVSIVVTPTEAGTLTDGATASFSQTDPTLSDNSVALTTTVSAAAAPDLALVGTAPKAVTLGTSVTYSLTVTNNGTAGATGVALTDTLPSGVSFVSATGGITPVNGVLTFAIGNLAAGADTSVSIIVTPTAAGTLTDGATAGFSQADPTLADNSVTLTTTVSAPPAADLKLAGDTPGSVTVGHNLTDTLTVTNNGAAGATGVTITDTLPPGVIFVSATGGITPASGVLTFAIGNLAAGASTSVTIVVTPTAVGMLDNRATVIVAQSDTTPAENSINQVVTVRAAGPVVTSVHRFGFHCQPTRLVLAFNERLDFRRAENPDNYQIVALGGDHRHIRIKTAVYHAATRTVTLRPVDRLNLHGLFRLTVLGTGPSGVTDPAGNPLDGDNSRDPGTNFVTIVTAAHLVLTTSNPATLRVAPDRLQAASRKW